jgi:hypothetical protein
LTPPVKLFSNSRVDYCYPYLSKKELKMKKIFFVLLVIVVATTFGMSFVCCSDDNGNGGDDSGVTDKGTDPNCCEGEKSHGYVKGMAVKFPEKTPISIQLTAITAVGAMTGTPPHLAEVKSAENGSYQTDCFNMSDSTMGILMLSDDDDFDGVEGDWYPTVSGVIDTSDEDNKTCTDDAPPVFGIPTALVSLLDTATGNDLTANGFVIIFVLDSDGKTPVGGAVLKDDKGNEITAALYPNATFDDFSATSTAEGVGLILIPGTGSLMVIDGAPHKDGKTWTISKFGGNAGMAMISPFIAE